MPKLKMAAPESAEQIARRLERDQQTMTRDRELELEGSLGSFRVGSVKYLNAAPLTRGLENNIVFSTPAHLAGLLRAGKLDAALVSITEVLFNDCYDVLDGVAIASLGEVKSVLLACKRPIEAVQEVFCDPASLTSVSLLKVLLAERGLKPEFKTLESYAVAREKDFVLLIGDPALDFLLSPHEHEILDLGAAWFELTRLPFVYGVWALRRGVENRELRRQLVGAKEFGLDTLDHIIRSRTEYTEEFRKDYLSWHIHYHLGADEKRGIAKFMELLRRHGAGQIHGPRFVA